MPETTPVEAEVTLSELTVEKTPRIKPLAKKIAIWGGIAVGSIAAASLFMINRRLTEDVELLTEAVEFQTEALETIIDIETIPED